jgi:hypothetical protein
MDYLSTSANTLKHNRVSEFTTLKQSEVLSHVCAHREFRDMIARVKGEFRTQYTHCARRGVRDRAWNPASKSLEAHT